MILKLGVPLATAAVMTLWAGSASAGEAPPRPKPRAVAHAGPAMRLQVAQLMLPPNRAFKPIGGDRPYFAWQAPARPSGARG